MGRVGKPGDIADLKEDLIEAVTNAYMARNTEHWGLSYVSGTCAEGAFYYLLDEDWESVGVKCTYPGNKWELADFSEETNEPFRPKLRELAAHNPYPMIRDVVSSWVDPWTECPDPDIFVDQAESLAWVANELYVTDEMREEPDQSRKPGTLKPVGHVHAAIQDLKGSLAGYDGLAIRALRNAYAHDITLAVSGQRNLAAIATLGLAAEAEAWSAALLGVKDFFKVATDDFNKFAEAGKPSKGEEVPLGAISAVVGVLRTATYANPALSLALGAGASFIGVVNAVAPGSVDVAPSPPVRLKGSDYPAVWESFKEQVTEISRDLREAEIVAGRVCRTAGQDLLNSPGYYSIGRKERDGREQVDDPEPIPDFLDAGPGNPSLLNVGKGVMTRAGAMIEVIGDHQRFVAGRLGGVDGQGNPSALVENEWVRPQLQGLHIGWGRNGHYAEFANLINDLVDLLLEESKTAHRIALQCVATGRDLEMTDEAVKTRLDAEVRKRLDGVAAPGRPDHPQEFFPGVS